VKLEFYCISIFKYAEGCSATGWRRLDESGSGFGQVVGYCESSNQHWGSAKCGVYLTRLEITKLYKSLLRGFIYHVPVVQIRFILFILLRV